MKNRFPDFFLIGAPKCGTTSMFDWLRQHPDVYLPVKEPNFLSGDVLDVSRHPGAFRSEAEYLDRLCPAEAANKLTGEATPKYLYSDIALDRLAREAEHVRLVVLLRNPVDLASAMHAQNVRQGYENEFDFARAWARGPARAGDRMTDYRFWGRPGSRLEKYFAVIPRNRILVLLLEEEMRHDPASAHAKVLDFLGLAPQTLDSYTAKNPRRISRSPHLQGLSRRARRSTLAALERIGLAPKGTGLLKLFDLLNHNRLGRHNLPADLRVKIAAELADDARCIAKCLNRASLPWDDFDWGLPSAASSSRKTT